MYEAAAKLFQAKGNLMTDWPCNLRCCTAIVDFVADKFDTSPHELKSCTPELSSDEGWELLRALGELHSQGRRALAVDWRQLAKFVLEILEQLLHQIIPLLVPEVP
jgi:hypothetical protein